MRYVMFSCTVAIPFVRPTSSDDATVTLPPHVGAKIDTAVALVALTPNPEKLLYSSVMFVLFSTAPLTLSPACKNEAVSTGVPSTLDDRHERETCSSVFVSAPRSERACAPAVDSGRAIGELDWVELPREVQRQRGGRGVATDGRLPHGYATFGNRGVDDNPAAHLHVVNAHPQRRGRRAAEGQVAQLTAGEDVDDGRIVHDDVAVRRHGGLGAADEDVRRFVVLRWQRRQRVCNPQRDAQPTRGVHCEGLARKSTTELESVRSFG